MAKIPQVDYGLVNGSGTWGCVNFPEDCQDQSVSVLEENLIFDTPFGETIPWKLVRIKAIEENTVAKDFLVVPMHGYRFGEESKYSRIECADQTFWVLKQAGAKMVIGQSSCGGLSPLLEVNDIVVPNDFIEDRVTRGVNMLSTNIRLKDPFCPDIRKILIEEAQKIFPRVMRRGTYVCFEGPRFETPAEIARMRQWGADIVSQSLCPEVYYARSIGACYASVHIVSNSAEGVNESGADESIMLDLYRKCGLSFGRMLLNAMKRLSLATTCRCLEYSKVEEMYNKLMQKDK